MKANKKSKVFLYSIPCLCYNKCLLNKPIDCFLRMVKRHKIMKSTSKVLLTLIK